MSEFIDEIVNNAKNGRISIVTIEGLCVTGIDELLNQPIEGVLYDLNRDDVSILSSTDKNNRWINDYAAAQIIKYQASRIAALESQLESLTPGGSEFHNNAQRCIEWTKDRLSTTGKIAAERNMLESQLAAANEDAKTLKAYSDHDGNCGINYGQDCCTCGYHVAVLRYESRIQEAQNG
jgi:hypothetical protein